MRSIFSRSSIHCSSDAEFHRTGLNPNFCILTGMSEHLSRDRIGVRGAHAPPETTPLLVHDADRRRLLRHVQSDIVRHPNLRWCKPPDDNRPDRGTIDGSRPFRDYPRSTQPPLAQLVREPARRDRRPAPPGNLGTQTRQRPTAIMARVFVQDRRRYRPGMRPNLGLLSWPWAPPQPRHPAMCEVTPPVTHRAGVRPENGGDLFGPPPFQCQQSLPRRRAGLARARSASPRCSDFDRARNAACSAASAVSFDFPAMVASTAPILGKQSIPSHIRTRSA